jgi:hypothetical protein
MYTVNYYYDNGELAKSVTSSIMEEIENGICFGLQDDYEIQILKDNSLLINKSFEYFSTDNRGFCFLITQ